MTLPFSDDAKIRIAFEQALGAISASVPTVCQGRDAPAGFDSTVGHQKCWLLPAENETLGLREKTTRHKGVFQVNLCYPSGTKGTTEADQRAAILQSSFFAGRELVADGLKVRVRGKPNIAAPLGMSPYTVSVSIRYEAII